MNKRKRADMVHIVLHQVVKDMESFEDSMEDQASTGAARATGSSLEATVAIHVGVWENVCRLRRDLRGDTDL